MLTLTFRDCGFAGRETAWLGDRLVGAVEPPGQSSKTALWSFYLEARHRLQHQPAASIEEARRLIAEQVNGMLRGFGVLDRDDAGVTILVDPELIQRARA
jgi:hypothetical protein